jgi:hypothetical protein
MYKKFRKLVASGKERNKAIEEIANNAGFWEQWENIAERIPIQMA